MFCQEISTSEDKLGDVATMICKTWIIDTYLQLANPVDRYNNHHFKVGMLDS